MTGVVVSQGTGRLIFAGAADGRPIKAVEGDRIGADIVQSIAAGQAALLGPDGLKTIRPSGAGETGSAAAAKPENPRQAESRLSRHQPVH